MRDGSRRLDPLAWGFVSLGVVDTVFGVNDGTMTGRSWVIVTRVPSRPEEPSPQQRAALLAMIAHASRLPSRSDVMAPAATLVKPLARSRSRARGPLPSQLVPLGRPRQGLTPPERADVSCAPRSPRSPVGGLVRASGCRTKILQGENKQ